MDTDYKEDASQEVMLTTIDNPYSPFDEWESWYNFDESKGYCTCGLLDRIANDYSFMSEFDARLERKRAIDEICERNILGIYVKIHPGEKPRAAKIEEE